ncbi:MAG: D-alanyl-D-alanine carboxypeptidase/D-alanyl-D-alanine-endopeptidase [Acidobacteria bacterium]|jgi:D-alanyl-D-alanine carboxypeptidase/D-alanyl-D-alanine-endopeptidase (penicillin-binding protein 4)|nr:D-alanyl-D-alanine carboxypeptidase/D-alanyl-D-alanine-endopeptidase [Acidobacteriota bacterium]
MKKTRNTTKIAGFLTFALAFFNLGIAAYTQETRTKIIVEKPTPTPTFTPLPTTSPTPTSTPTPIQTVADLQSRIQIRLARPELRRGQIGIKIASLDTGKVIFETNAEKYFMPASNMKSYTVATALEKLSPNFRFVTSVFAGALPDASGTIRGDLSVYGRGDISFSTSFYENDYYKGLDALATLIAQAGVKRVEGNLVGDESYFAGNPIPSGWEWDDLQWYYGAEVSALAVNDNAIDLRIKPGSIGASCAVQTLPSNTIVKISNRCTVSAAGVKRELRIIKKLDQNTIEITGTMPADDKGFEGYVAVSRPAELFIEMLRGLLIKKGVVITGQNRVIGVKEKLSAANSNSPPPVEITKVESPPFNIIAAKTMKPSQNLYTETILWTLGEQIGRKEEVVATTAAPGAVLGTTPDKKLSNASSAELGVKTVQNFLRQIGMPPDSVIQSDGSGLSRHNLITPDSAVKLYSYMAKSQYANVWRDSLTIGAVDGTLRNRFKGTSAAANVRGKTGTIDQVSSLSGYVNTRAGEKLVFSILINGVADGKVRQAAIDEIILLLSDFNGRIN